MGEENGARGSKGSVEISKDEVENLRSFLRIPTVSGSGVRSGAYAEAALWLSEFALLLGLPCEVVECVEGKPVVLMTWQGSEPSLPCVLLNSHYDVVPAMSDHWDTDPFAGELTADGRIYGRGAQDMKCVCVQYLEAIRRLQAADFVPVRTVYLSFVPDEEIGGKDGMGAFLASELWQAMQPVGLALDEGLANTADAYTVFYGERTPWWLLVKATGNTGHGSRFIEDTAMMKLVEVCNKALAFREQQREELGHHGGCSHATAKKLGDVTTLNLTLLRGGVTADGGKTFSLNVIPIEAEAGFDVRISPHLKPEDFRAMVDEWCKEEGVTWDFAEWTSPLSEHYLTSLDRAKNPWWGLFVDTMKEVGTNIDPEIFPAATDSRFLRQLGVPALGFSPMRNTPVLLHEHNEYLDKGVFLEGIAVYERLIGALASAQRFDKETVEEEPSS